ncbi:hypothetical protein NDA03_23550 [Trichocoleus sp. Lan]|uniref:hypothetical protein n=1 Tax=Trichocoleus sp. Lan TaxID=2933927 RepID=UPI0032990684
MALEGRSLNAQSGHGLLRADRLMLQSRSNPTHAQRTSLKVVSEEALHLTCPDISPASRYPFGLA